MAIKRKIGFWAAPFCGALALGSAGLTFANPILTTLVNFNGTSGSSPYSSLVADQAGNLYGTTSKGGVNGDGTIFELAANTHAFSTIVNFNGSNGNGPRAGLAIDSQGDLFGTTQYGDTSDLGTVFEVASNSNTVTTLVNFSGGNGQNPTGGLAIDPTGNLYGTTYNGNSVFEYSPSNQMLTTLATFRSTAPYGYSPYAGVAIDSSGNIFGTNVFGGARRDGTVYEIAAGTRGLSAIGFSLSNGNNSQALVTADANGNIFGTAPGGGPGGGGTVFEVSAGSQTISTLAYFTDAPSSYGGFDPIGGVIIDAAGNLYGTTAESGVGGGTGGTIFKVAAGTDALTVLASFTGPSESWASLFADPNGNLYGTTLNGGMNNEGSVFELTGSGFVVPEPTSMSLLILATSIAVLGRKKSRRSFRDGMDGVSSAIVCRMSGPPGHR